MIRKLLCWLGLHDPELHTEGLLFPFSWIECRYCGRKAG